MSKKFGAGEERSEEYIDACPSHSSPGGRGLRKSRGDCILCANLFQEDD